MEQSHQKSSALLIVGLFVLLVILLLAVLYGWQALSSMAGRGGERAPLANDAPASAQPNDGSQGQTVTTDTHAQSQEQPGTPQAAPLGTEGDPGELECLKRLMEQTSAPPGGPQQADAPNGQSGEGSQGQTVTTDTHAQSQEQPGTPQAAPLGTEGDPGELECLKRLMEQTSVPPGGPQQADPSP